MRWTACCLMTLAAFGCAQQPASTAVDETASPAAAEANPVAFNSEGAPTVTMSVPGMMCEHGCVPKVREILTAQDGVKDVKIEFDEKQAIVAVDEATFDANSAVAELEDKGFSDSQQVMPEGTQSTEVVEDQS